MRKENAALHRLLTESWQMPSSTAGVMRSGVASGTDLLSSIYQLWEARVAFHVHADAELVSSAGAGLCIGELRSAFEEGVYAITCCTCVHAMRAAGARSQTAARSASLGVLLQGNIGGLKVGVRRWAECVFNSTSKRRPGASNRVRITCRGHGSCALQCGGKRDDAVGDAA